MQKCLPSVCFIRAIHNFVFMNNVFYLHNYITFYYILFLDPGAHADAGAALYLPNNNNDITIQVIFMVLSWPSYKDTRCRNVCDLPFFQPTNENKVVMITIDFSTTKYTNKVFKSSTYSLSEKLVDAKTIFVLQDFGNQGFFKFWGSKLNFSIQIVSFLQIWRP
jgi:hypothetical protein